MDVCEVYVIDKNAPSRSTVSAEGDFLKLLYYDYHSNPFSHVSFVHHDYINCWERGIPIIHVANHLKFFKNAVETVPGKYVTVFLPNNVSSENANELSNQLEEIRKNANGEKYYYNLVYVKEKTKFGYNYECYPPMYITGKKISFQDAVSIFLRDAFHQSTEVESLMFDEFRNFNLSKMLTETSDFSYPINHNYCGVVIVDSGGERYSSTVTKNGHQQTLNYLLSCMSGRDINDEGIESLQEKVIEFSTAVLLFREGEVFSYIPERVSKSQHDELMRFADEIDTVSSVSDVVFGTRVLSNGDLVDEELSFRDSISKSYQEFQSEKSRGREHYKST